MNCPKCGAASEKEEKFCAYCGASLAEAQQETLSDTSPTAKPKKKPVIIIAISALLVIAALALVFFLPNTGDKSAPKTREHCNFNNGALVAFDEDTLYFVAPFIKNDSETGVFSTAYDGTNKTLISDDTSIGGIRIANGKILYYAFADGILDIGFMDKNGSNNNIITTMKLDKTDHLVCIDASESALYYLFNFELRSCSLKGENDTLLLDGVTSFILEGDTIYYATESALYSYKINKTNKDTSREICAATAEMLTLSDGRIFFCDDGDLYSVPIKGNEAPKQLTDGASILVYVMNGDEIYFVDMYDQAERISFAEEQYGEGSADYEVLFTGSGPIMRIAKDGGAVDYLDSELPIAAQLFSYPGGIYFKISIFVHDLICVMYD